LLLLLLLAAMLLLGVSSASALLLLLLAVLVLSSVRMGFGVGRIVAACLISSRPSSCKRETKCQVLTLKTKTYV
jgi:hypothetical protein